MISFLPKLQERIVMTPKEKEDNFLSYMPPYHFSFVAFQLCRLSALSQLCHYSQQFSRIAIKKSKVAALKEYFKIEAIF